jgi:predicted transcriptional regulator
MKKGGSMNIQREVLEHFKGTFGERSYSEYSKIVGIERTRVFRLFQGADMKVSELEKFQTVLHTESSGKSGWFKAMTEFDRVADKKIKKEQQALIERKLHLKAVLEQAKLSQYLYA